MFTLAYTDLSVPMGGIPIQAIRTYDSRNPNTGDFGVGWTLGIKNTRVTANGAIGDGWFALFGLMIQPTRAHTVSVTLPGGQNYTFEATITSSGCGGNVCIGFTPSGITPPNAALAWAGSNWGYIDSLAPSDGSVRFLGADGNLEDPDQYILTGPAGRQLLVSRQNGLQSTP